MDEKILAIVSKQAELESTAADHGDAAAVDSDRPIARRLLPLS